MPSIAPLIAAVQRRLANLPGPVRGSGEASNGEPVQVELYVAGEWVDITSRTLVRDDRGRINITAGIRDEGSQTQAAQSSLELDNDDGRLSPRNPVGAYYDILTWRNAQIRVSVPDGNGGKKYLLWGEGSEWEPNWDSSGSHVWTDVAVNGILHRLAQAPAPEHSIIYRAITEPFLPSLVAYWPCEDPDGSIELASALVNGSAMSWTGDLELASYDGFGASDPLPVLTGSSFTGGIGKYDTTSVTQYQMRYLLAVPAAGFSNVDVISRIEVDQGAYNLKYLDIHYNDPPGGVGSYGGRGTLTILLKDGDQADLATSGTPSISLDTRGRLLRVSLEVQNNGTALSVTLRVLDIESGVEDSTTIGLVTTQVTRVTNVSMAPETLAGSAGVTAAAVGHVLLQTTITDIGDLGRAIQPTGEAAGRRMQRLCAEEGIAFEWIGDLDDTVAMGPQGKANLLSLVQECVQADGGFLYETTSQLGLGYRTRTSLYGQDPALTLSYTGYNLADIPVPVSDDRYIQNRLVVTVNGVSQTYEETSGALGTDRIGVYGETSGVTLNLASTDAGTLRDHAAWRVRLGTVDDERYPKISVNLAHPSMTPELKRAILGLRTGDRMQLTGMPSWLAPDTVDQLIIGASHSLSRFLHEITFTCLPAAPYNQVGVVDGDDARIDIDTELLTAVGSSDTSLVVAPAAGETLLWTTDSAEWPFDVRLGGEVVTVTGVTGWLADTFTRTESSGWGSPDAGSAWSIVGAGAAADYSVDGTTGLHTMASINTTYRTAVTAADADFDIYCDITTNELSTGSSIFGAVTARMQDVDNMYLMRLEFTTSNTVLSGIRKIVAGSQSSLGIYTVPVTHVAGTYIRVRFQGIGSTFKAKAWTATDAVEPPEWHITATDSAISQPHTIGARSIRNPGSTNTAAVAVQFDNFRVVNPQTLTVTRSVNGVTKSHDAGTPVSLAYPTYIAL